MNNKIKIEPEIYQELIEFYGTLFNLPPLSAKIYAYLIFDFDKKGHTFDELLEVFCASKSSISSSINFLLNNNLLLSTQQKLTDSKNPCSALNRDFLYGDVVSLLNIVTFPLTIFADFTKFSL